MTNAATSRTIAAPRINGRTPEGGGLFGFLPELSRDPLGFFATMTRDYGDFVPLRLGLTPSVIIGHPNLVEDVLVTHNNDYRKGFGTRRLGSLLGNGLLLSEGEFWLRQRRLMQPAFHRQRLTTMANSMVEITSDLIGGWRNGQQKAINQEMIEVTVRVVGRALFGTDVREDLDTIRLASRVFSEHFRSRLFTMLTLIPDQFPTPGNLRYQRAVRDLDRMVARIIAARRSGEKAGNDLLDMLLEARDDTGRGMDDHQLRDEVTTLLLAGFDTTALALTWAFVLLAQYPGVEARLHDDLQAVLGGRLPTMEDAPRLRYVEHVVAETLRLYPSAWAIGRDALRTTDLGGQRVEKGMSVLFSPWAFHRDPRFWEQPDVFLPERWERNDAPRHRYAYLPFGGGQRVCIGASFAQLEATLVLATIAQQFRLELVEAGRAVEPWPVVTLRTRGDVPMRLVART